VIEACDWTGVALLERDDAGAEPDALGSQTYGARAVGLRRLSTDRPPAGHTLRDLIETMKALDAFSERAGVVPPPGTLSRTVGACSATDGDYDGEAWMSMNDRRVFLIRKEADSGLSPSEEGELEELQSIIADYINKVAPLPWDRLEALERKVRELGIE
jgi:hypothetical protein